MEEIFKDIIGFEGLYQISNLGNVKSLPKKIVYGRKYSKTIYLPEKILKPKYDKDGYLRIGLRKNKKTKTLFLHRLIAQAFIPNPQNKKQINHINGIKDDNRIENLEWYSPSENIKHSYYVLGNDYSKNFKKYKSRENPRNIPILMLDKNKKIIKEFYNSIEASTYLKEKINIKSKRPQSFIRRCCKTGKKGYGYYWKNKESEENK